MAKHDLITKDFALYVVHYFASMLTWSKEDIIGEIDIAIKEAKPADAVEVVRCKDCKHLVLTEEGEHNPDDCVCNYWMTDGLTDDDFCSYGERREGE